MARYVTIATVNTRPVFCKDLPQDRSPVEFMVEHLRQDIAPVLCDHPDLIVLPELCDRILDATPEENLRFAREKKDRMMQFMQETARENRCYLVYPTHRFLPDGSVRNALYLLGRNGEIVGVYHKNFLMVSETERYGLICGKEMPVFECDFGRICPLICFDLNFEENRKSIKELAPDITVFCSMYHGSFVENFVAYDTRSYFVSAFSNACACESGILSPLGESIAHTTNYQNYITATVNLDCEVCHLDFNQEKFCAAKRKYGRKVQIHDPGRLGSALVSSETEEFTVDELLDEFGIERLDDYMARSRRHRELHTEA